MLRNLQLIATVIAVCGQPVAATEPEWDPIYWNPVAMDGDVTLPFPCGGAMTFRKIDTPAANSWLADSELQMGNVGISGQEHAEGAITRGLAGGLTRSDPKGRFYLLGKYEVTRDQYAAVMTNTCPDPDDAGAIPADDMPWLDAQTFAARYTTWLYENARDVLSAQAGDQAFARLPTETEWEFAARGGLAVTEPERRKRQFAMNDGNLADYVWFAGFKSCAGDMQPIGLLLPNPLGLFDILGNAQEFTSDSYQLRTRDRLHGQVGGAVARGGSCLTNEMRVRTAARDEIMLFDAQTGALRGKKFTGLRLAFGAPVLADQARIAAINADWKDLGDTRLVLDPNDNPINALAVIAEAEGEGPVRDALLRAKDIFETEMARRNQIESRSARSAMQGGFLATRDFIVTFDGLIRGRELAADFPENLAFQASVDRYAERLAITKDVFLAILVHAAEDYDAQTLENAARIQQEESAVRLSLMTERTRITTARLQDLFAKFVRIYRADGDTPPNVFFDALIAYHAELTGR
jgi:hypothetical protein